MTVARLHSASPARAVPPTLTSLVAIPRRIAPRRIARSKIKLDLAARYRLDDRFQLFAEFVNLTNAPYVAFQNGPGAPRLLQFEEYRLTAKFGARASF